MRSTWVLALSMASLALLAAGCPSTSSTSTGATASGDPTELAAQARPPILDVPVPVGFRYVDKESYNFAAPGVRMLVHTYRGSGEKYAVRRFFHKQVPLAGWAYTTEGNSQGVITMDFQKEGEICRVTISEGGFWDKTEIKVHVYPIQGGMQPPARK